MAIDLSDLKDGGSTDTREPIEVEAAFLVIFRGGGIVQASTDINAPIIPARAATVDEMEMAAHKIAADIQATKTAQVVQMNMQHAAHAAMQQAEGQRIAQSLNI
ncbi:hypothetical protein ACIOHC_35730 [Streptomyces sp. NPDC088252]|uniref:hypothetical protein n=1 Tax=Streptomyces sp. NPDC088252 TaxID=3365845 RepID=UPI0038026708